MALKTKKITAEEYFTTLSTFIMEFINIYQEEILRKILVSEDYTEEPQRFYYTIMNKTLCSLDVINILLRNFDRKRHYHTPLFILIRPIILDIIIGEYIIYIPQSDETRKELIQRINIDHIENILKSAKSAKSAASIYGWTQETLEEKKMQ